MAERIKILRFDYALDEAALNAIEEQQGLTLISVNHVVTHESAGDFGMGSSVQVEHVRWTYHFRENEPPVKGVEGGVSH